MDNKRAIIYRLLPLGFCLFLAMQFVVSSVTTAAIRSYSEEEQHAASISDLYQQACYWLSDEAANENEYLVDGNLQHLVQYQAAVHAFQQTIAPLIQVSTDSDKNTLQTLSASHDRHVLLVHQILDAEQTQNEELAEQIDEQQANPLLDAIQHTMQERANHYHAEELARQQDVVTHQSRAMVVIPVSCGICFVFLALMWLYQRNIQRALGESQVREIQRLRQAALSDPLTGLGNHRAYQEDLQREIQRAMRYGFSLTLALLDIDRFREINDLHGHAVGDQMLVMVGRLLANLIVNGQVYRLGSDEFTILLPHRSLPQTVTLMEGARQAIQREVPEATVSIGLAEMQEREGNAQLLEKQTQAALDDAKQRGYNIVVPFTAMHAPQSILSTTHLHAVRQILHDQRMNIVFQPIWDVTQRRLLAVEALSRPDPMYGFCGPQELFDIAERAGYEAELDLLSITATLQRAHHVPKDAFLFMNLCPRSLEHKLFAGDRLLHLVQAAGLPAERVTIEITERTIQHLDIVIHAIASLQASGFKIALDDTGAGNSGLELLTHLPVDFVKIDRGIVVKAMTDRAARGVLAGMIAIARGIGSHVIIEGIEDQAMLETITSMISSREQDPVDITMAWAAQGYYLGRPSEDIPHAYPHHDNDASSPRAA
jgi:diguanylate cyclase (GGDEF)-like protein